MSLWNGVVLNGLLPHGICFAGRPDLVWLHVASDALIALAYFVIPVTLVVFLRRHRTVLSFNWAIALFAAFIVLCGTGHVLSFITVWQPIYYLQGWVKALTAVVSVATAVAIIPLVPRLLAMRSPEELEAANARLAEANRQLAAANQQLADANQQLAEANGKLADANGQLEIEAEARRQAEAEVRGSLEEARRSGAELEQFAYIASHDLQAPLRNIAGFARLLEKRHGTQLDGDGREFLDFIHKGIQQMQSLITDLLALSRIGRGKDVLVESLPLSISLQKAVGLYAEEIASRKAEIVIGPMPTLETEHRLLGQLFQNLVGNALKFQPAAAVPRLEISAQESATEWLIRFTDNGIGIAADQLESVFDIFRRLHSQDEYEGSGIGLSISRKIATYLGGSLVAQSSGEGMGTSFLLRLPKIRSRK